METKDKIIELLNGTNRKGISDLIGHLLTTGFFESPASTKFHGCYKGGLADHSLRVYELLMFHSSLKLDAITLPGQKPLPVTVESVTIAALLHDVCKVGAYTGTEKPYVYNKQHPKGHAELSIERASEFIVLEPIEEMMIRFHMGVYGLNEFYKKGDWQTGEYPLRGDHIACKGMNKEESKEFRYGKSMANAWYHNPICKVMYFCDEIATLEEKAKESQ